MLDFLIYSVYIKVLIGDEKDGFGEFIKNLSGTRIKSHCWVLGIIPPVVFPLAFPRHLTERG